MEPAKKITGNPESDNNLSRDQLINKYIPYVKRIVGRMAIHLPSSVIERDDLINAGIIGLIQAADRYDPARDNKFITYAVFRIKGSILSEFRRRDFLSRSNRKKIRDMEKVYLKLEQKLKREATDNELAVEMGLELEQIYQIKMLTSISFISFDDIGYSTTEEKDNLEDWFTDNNKTNAFHLTRLNELKAAVAEAIDQLPEKEKMIMSLYYQDTLTMKEVGKVLEITESRVCQIHSKAIIHLREALRRQGIIDD